MNVALVALLMGLAPPAAQPDEVTVPEYEQFVIVPLRVHVLTTDNLDLGDGTLSDGEITRILGSLNALWHKAGVHFGLESIVREPADQTERFRLVARQRPDGIYPGLFQMLLPRATRAPDGLNAYFFHDLPFNSAYLGDDSILVREQPELARVQGGGDDPVVRVMAHAVGHALGLSIHPDPENLMAIGTTGLALNAGQLRDARVIGRTIPGASAVGDLRDAARAAESRGDRDRALRLWSWLSQVPGTGATGAKRRWDSLRNP
jgi:hypothetical protein